MESRIHNWIHGAVATVYSEPIVAGFHSPQSTYFYQIHGMVDIWWNRFLHPKTIIKDIIDHVGKIHIKEIIKEHKEFKEKDKDLIENMDLTQKINPEVLKLQARIQSLEILVKKGAPFIKPNERPKVGKQVTKRAVRRKK